MVIIFLRVSNSWFASCSDKRLRCSRGKTGTAGNVLKTVCTKPFNVMLVSHFKESNGVCAVSLAWCRASWSCWRLSSCRAAAERPAGCSCTSWTSTWLSWQLWAQQRYRNTQRNSCQCVTRCKTEKWSLVFTLKLGKKNQVRSVSAFSYWSMKLEVKLLCEISSWISLFSAQSLVSISFKGQLEQRDLKKTLFCLCSCRLFNLIHNWTFIWLIVMMFCWCTDQLIRQLFFSLRWHVYSPVICTSFFPLLSSLLIRTWHSSSRSAKQYPKQKSKSTSDQLLCFFYCDAVSK